MLYVLYWNILALTPYLPQEHFCCTFSTKTFLLLPYTLHWNILALGFLLEHSCCTSSTGTFLLFPYKLHYNILAVRSLLVHSCCYQIPSTTTFLLYLLYWNILAVTLYTPSNILFAVVHQPFVPVKFESSCSFHFKTSINSPFFSFRKL